MYVRASLDGLKVQKGLRSWDSKKEEKESVRTGKAPS